MLRGTCLILGILVGSLGSLAFAEDAHTPTPKAMEYRSQGYRFQEQGDVDKAIVAYRNAIEADPQYATAFNDLGILYEKKGMYDAAEKSYLRALKVDNDYKGANSNLAYYYENQGDLDKSIAFWKKRLSLEPTENTEWGKKARGKIDELMRRKEVQTWMSSDQKKQVEYENQAKAAHQGWVPPSAGVDVQKTMGERYFDQGETLFKQRRYDESLAAFKLARTYSPKEKAVNNYIVKIQKIQSALEEHRVDEGRAFKGAVSEEDRMLSRDHFKMGLDAYTKQDYQKAFACFTMALTYNPYDDTIRRYIEDSKVKIEEAKVRKGQIRDDAQRRQIAKLKEPLDIRREMVKQKEDVINKGYVMSSEDVSVESFMKDGKELFKKGRYEDAQYVWTQALLLDVAGLYKDELKDLIDSARHEVARRNDKQLDQYAGGVEDTALTDVTRAAIPSKDGAPLWSLTRTHHMSFPHEEVSADKLALEEKLKTRYTLNFKDASLKGVVDMLAELTGLNIVIDTKGIATEDVNKTNITFRVTDMPLIEIIEAVLRFTDLDYLIEKNMIWITTKKSIDTQDISLVVYDVQDIVGKVFDFPAEELDAQLGKSSGSSGSSSSSNG